MSSAAYKGKSVVLKTLGELIAELSRDCDWENDTLERYLEALAALLESIENSYKNSGREVPDDPWIVISDALKGARYYE